MNQWNEKLNIREINRLLYICKIPKDYKQTKENKIQIQKVKYKLLNNIEKFNKPLSKQLTTSSRHEEK